MEELGELRNPSDIIVQCPDCDGRNTSLHMLIGLNCIEMHTHVHLQMNTGKSGKIGIRPMDCSLSIISSGVVKWGYSTSITVIFPHQLFGYPEIQFI